MHANVPALRAIGRLSIVTGATLGLCLSAVWLVPLAYAADRSGEFELAARPGSKKSSSSAQKEMPAAYEAEEPAPEDDLYDDVPFVAAPEAPEPKAAAKPKTKSVSAKPGGVVTPDILLQQFEDQEGDDVDDPLFSEQIFLEEEAPEADALERQTPPTPVTPPAEPIIAAPPPAPAIVPEPPLQAEMPMDNADEPEQIDIAEPPAFPPEDEFLEDDVPALAEPEKEPRPRFARPDEYQAPDDEPLMADEVPALPPEDDFLEDDAPVLAAPVIEPEPRAEEPVEIVIEKPVDEPIIDPLEEEYEFTFPDSEPELASEPDFADYEEEIEEPDPEEMARQHKLEEIGPFDEQFRMPVSPPVDLAEPAAPVRGDKAKLAPGSKQILRDLPTGLSSVDEDEVAKKPINIDRTDGMPSAFPPEGYSDKTPIGISVGMTQPEEGIDKILDTAYEALLFGQMETAIALYRQVLDREPGNRLGLFGLATAYQRNRQVTQARYVYDRLFRLYPDYPEALNNFLVLISEEAPDEALLELEKLSQRNPRYSPIPAQMGMVYLQQSDFGQAAQFLARAVSLSPENITYRYNLAIVMDQLGEGREAATLYEQVLKAGQSGAQLPTTSAEIQKRLTFLQSKSR